MSSNGNTPVMWVKTDREWVRSLVGSSRRPYCCASGERNPLASMRNFPETTLPSERPSRAARSSTATDSATVSSRRMAPYFCATRTIQ